VTYVTDARIKRLNRLYMSKDRPTDVMAFSMLEGKRLKGQDKFLGDIVISVDTAKRQAREFGTTKEYELKLYLIHGALHLLGYDDRTPGGFKKMKKRQEELFERV